MDFIKKYQKYFITSILVLVILISFVSYNITNAKNESDDLLITTSHSNDDLIFYVDIKGAVKKPGVYEFEEGKRVVDAINTAGGLTKSANTSNINLSQKLTNEMVVYVYTNNEIKNGSNKINCSTYCATNNIEVNNCYEKETDGKININTANMEALMTLPGVGEAKAKAIIDYREKNGLFETLEDITNVSGIGSANFENIKDLITI